MGLAGIGGGVADFARWRRTLLSLAGQALAALALGACGMDGGDVRVPEPRLALLAGSTAGPGNVDGPAAVARFGSLAGIASDGAGNLYVDDLDNDTVRKITPTGEVVSVSGGGELFRATDAAGNVYRADQYTVRKVTPAGEVSVLAGTPGQTLFEWPTAVTVDKGTGNVYVMDSRRNAIKKVTPAGEVSTLGNPQAPGSSVGPGEAASFRFCTSERQAQIVWWFCPSQYMATDPAGNLYVPDYFNDRIRRITPEGVMTTYARLGQVMDVATDAAGTVYATTGSMSRDAGIPGVVYRVPPGGPAEFLAGQAGLPGSAEPIVHAADRCSIMVFAVDPWGTLYSAGAGRPGRPQVMCWIAPDDAGALPLSGMGDVSLWPGGMVADATGKLLVTDTQRHLILEIAAQGSVRTLAGSDRRQGHADGIGEQALFTGPNGIAIDAAGNLYVTESASAIRKVTPGAVVSTLAGSVGQSGSSDGPAAVARFNRPEGVAADSAGNVYVADTGNHTIRKITPQGWVSTLAGSAGEPGSADGVGGSARFFLPHDVAVDHTGNVFVSDRGNHTIRRVSPAGEVSTVVGVPGQRGFVAGALPGVISAPRRLAVSGSTLYFMTYDGVAMVTDLRRDP